MARKILRTDGQTIDLQQVDADKVFSQELIWTTAEIAKSGSANLNQTSFANKALIKQIIVSASASTDFDFEIYEEDDFDTKDKIYSSTINNLLMNVTPTNPIEYLDIDGTSELHIKIKNDDSSNNSTFTIKIKYVKVQA